MCWTEKSYECRTGTIYTVQVLALQLCITGAVLFQMAVKREGVVDNLRIHELYLARLN